jgi:hypothetical protein
MPGPENHSASVPLDAPRFIPETLVVSLIRQLWPGRSFRRRRSTWVGELQTALNEWDAERNGNAELREAYGERPSH